MHWSYYALMASALVAAHFGGPLAGTLAFRCRWSYSNSKAVLAAAIGIPYLIVLTVLLLVLRAPPSRVPWTGLAVLPILLYARLRMKRVLYPGLSWLEEPPRER
jgi:hypothetical protein